MGGCAELGGTVAYSVVGRQCRNPSTGTLQTWILARDLQLKIHHVYLRKDQQILSWTLVLPGRANSSTLLTFQGTEKVPGCG